MYLHRNFYEHEQANANLFKKFYNKIKNKKDERRPLNRNC